MNWIATKDKLPEVGQPVVCARNMGNDVWWYGCCVYREFGFPFIMFRNPNPVQYWYPIKKPGDNNG